MHPANHADVVFTALDDATGVKVVAGAGGGLLDVDKRGIGQLFAGQLKWAFAWEPMNR